MNFLNYLKKLYFSFLTRCPIESQNGPDLSDKTESEQVNTRWELARFRNEEEWEELLRNGKFMNKLKRVCTHLHVEVDHMLIVMRAESNISTSAQNPSTKATGLIQFMPATAEGLGTSVSELKQMTWVQQLDYVQRYFEPYKWRLHSVEDLYKVVFFPAAVWKSIDWKFRSNGLSAYTIAKANPAITKFSDSSEYIDWHAFKRYIDHLINMFL